MNLKLGNKVSPGDINFRVKRWLLNSWLWMRLLGKKIWIERK